MPVRFNTSRRGLIRAQTELRDYPDMYATNVHYDAQHGAYNGTSSAEALGTLVGTLGTAAATEYLKTEQLRQQQAAERARLQAEAEKAQKQAALMDSATTLAKWVLGGAAVLFVASKAANYLNTRSM